MSRCEDEQMWEKMWRWADVKMSRCERRCEDEQMWRWADVREDVKMSRCERRCEDEQMWRWADVREDVKMSRCEDEQMWEKMWRWADVKENVKMRRCLEDVKMRRCFTDPHYWKNPALRRSREKKHLSIYIYIHILFINYKPSLNWGFVLGFPKLKYCKRLVELFGTHASCQHCVVHHAVHLHLSLPGWQPLAQLRLSQLVTVKNISLLETLKLRSCPPAQYWNTNLQWSTNLVEYKASNIIESMWFKRFATPFAGTQCLVHLIDQTEGQSPVTGAGCIANHIASATLGPEMHETRQRCLWSFQAIIIHIYIYISVFILYVYIYILYVNIYIYTVCEYIYIYTVCEYIYIYTLNYIYIILCIYIYIILYIIYIRILYMHCTYYIHVVLATAVRTDCQSPSAMETHWLWAVQRRTYSDDSLSCKRALQMSKWFDFGQSALLRCMWFGEFCGKSEAAFTFIRTAIPNSTTAWGHEIPQNVYKIAMKSSRKVWEQGLTVIPSVPTSLYMSIQARRLSRLDFIAFWRPFVSTAQKSRQLHTLLSWVRCGVPLSRS